MGRHLVSPQKDLPIEYRQVESRDGETSSEPLDPAVWNLHQTSQLPCKLTCFLLKVTWIIFLTLNIPKSTIHYSDVNTQKILLQLKKYPILSNIFQVNLSFYNCLFPFILPILQPHWITCSFLYIVHIFLFMWFCLLFFYINALPP